MVDWNMVSPTYLVAVAEWVGAVVTVLAVGPGEVSNNQVGNEL